MIIPYSQSYDYSGLQSRNYSNRTVWQSFLPDYLVNTLDEIEITGEYEKIVGKTVDIPHNGWVDISLLRKIKNAALRPTTYHPRHVCLRRQPASSGQDKGIYLGRLLVKGIYPPFHFADAFMIKRNTRRLLPLRLRCQITTYI